MRLLLLVLVSKRTNTIGFQIPPPLLRLLLLVGAHNLEQRENLYQLVVPVPVPALLLLLALLPMMMMALEVIENSIIGGQQDNIHQEGRPGGGLLP